jgi:hypothetical protein
MAAALTASPMGVSRRLVVNFLVSFCCVLFG